MQNKPLRRVERVDRDPEIKGRATLTLACGHTETVDDFPESTPPPCFRRYCPVPGCANA